MTSKEVVSLALFLCHQPKAEDDGRASILVTKRIADTTEPEEDFIDVSEQMEIPFDK